jgi:hypothetical protein
MTPETKKDLLLSLRAFCIVMATGLVGFAGLLAAAYYIG